MGIILSYLGQPSGAGHEHLWEIRVDQSLAENLSFFYKEIIEITLDQGQMSKLKKVNKALPEKVENPARFNQNGTYTWNNFSFRSQAEIVVAKALESRGLVCKNVTR
jgi:hypothetical protein